MLKKYENLCECENTKEFLSWFEEIIFLDRISLEPMESANKIDDNDGFTNQPNLHRMLNRFKSNDRKFPLDTIELKVFEDKNSTQLETPIIHYGLSSDEFARSHSAFAIAIGNDIFIRDGHYKPETEAGRALLAHELIHVQQHSEKRITKQTSKQELENEATMAEKKEYYESDPIITTVIKNITFKIRKSKLPILKTRINNAIENLIENYCASHKENSVLKLLIAYEDILNKIGFEEWDK